MDSRLYSPLIHLADSSKEVGYYPVADIAFALLAKDCIALPEPEEHEVPVLWFGWECDDPNSAVDLGDCFFDVPWVMTYDGHPMGVNAPAPHLNKKAAIAILQGAELVQREEHNRETRRPNTGEVERLWQELFEIVSRDECAVAVREVFTPEKIEKVLEAMPS